MPARPPTVELDLPFARALPDRLRPMLPMPAAAPFDSPEYAFDVAWDGVRALASIDGSEVRAWGRDLLDLTPRYPELQELSASSPPETIVDGELIVSDVDGRPDMVALEIRQHADPHTVTGSAPAHPVTYVVYDLLYLRGRPLLKEPLARRRAKLVEAIRSSGRIYVVEPVAQDGLAFYDAARETGLEGVVAKRLDSPYRAGQRHPDWLQIDAVRRQDFAVLGFIPEAGDRLLEALIVATYDGRSFQPAGRVVGGFDPATSIRLRRTLDTLPSVLAAVDPRWSDNRICWVKPQTVVNIKFSEWDRHGQLRFPIFNGLKPEVAPEECVRAAVLEPPEPMVSRRVEVALPRLPI
ncbi:MAG TPA: DNA ligase [Candidatus Dormibacteraeota bacterium]|nr:DNA ligase [Candidatus Dormibacteraeota bacterium]